MVERELKPIMDMLVLLSAPTIVLCDAHDRDWLYRALRGMQTTTTTTSKVTTTTTSKVTTTATAMQGNQTHSPPAPHSSFILVMARLVGLRPDLSPREADEAVGGLLEVGSQLERERQGHGHGQLAEDDGAVTQGAGVDDGNGKQHWWQRKRNKGSRDQLVGR